MLHLICTLILSFVLIGLLSISDGFGDVNCTLQTWAGSFILPIWSLFAISLWYDVGRILWTKTFNVGRKIPNHLRSIIFILWMSVVFTYIMWTHISLFAIPLLLVIPVLGIPFGDLMTHDWSVKPKFTLNHTISLLLWAASSYLTYWILTIAWILLRVWLLDTFENGTVYYIQ